MGPGDGVGPAVVVGPDGVVVVVVVGPPVYSPGQNPLHSPHCTGFMSPSLVTAQLDLPW